MANVLTVNVAQPRPNSDKGQLLTGIDKRPTDDPIGVRAPGPMHGGAGSGLVGDFIGDRRYTEATIRRYTRTRARISTSGSGTGARPQQRHVR